uniref:Pentatricopeptide repeat-containing protein n=1 Tax=Kalanchoe fedtschenkoi TaxID=63787 RepID=A0A7N0T9Y3_KALFE
MNSKLQFFRVFSSRRFSSHPTNVLASNRVSSSSWVHTRPETPRSAPESENFRSVADECQTNESAHKVQNFLKNKMGSSVEAIEGALDKCGWSLNDELVLNVLIRHRSDWHPAYIFFNWATRRATGYSPGSRVYNEMLDILGKLKRFDEVAQLLDEMSDRKGLFNERSYGIVVHRYAAAHKVEEAKDFFYRRPDFGLEMDSIAFQTLLMALCRYKHVEVAELLFRSANSRQFCGTDIKTRNIILNGWCVLGSLKEAKRFWNDIITSRCKPDRFTYGIFINSLTKAGKLSSAVKLFRSMWEKGCDPDVAICNCIIDALCFKKKIPEALEIFREMNERNCLPDVATYNSLIKHLCKIQRMEKVYELLDEMEQKKGDCMPNGRTYGYLLKSVKAPEEVPKLVERMERNGCKMTGDVYNLILSLYVKWDLKERVKSTWNDMEKNGMGPDQRSYTIMIHGLYDKEVLDESLKFYNEMKSKGMVPEPRTVLLVNAMNIKLKEKRSKPATVSAEASGGTKGRRIMSGERK